MLLLSEHDKDEIEIHIKSVYGVTITLKQHDKNALVVHNIIAIHWMKEGYQVILTKINGEELFFDTATFYWLSFEPSTILKK